MHQSYQSVHQSDQSVAVNLAVADVITVVMVECLYVENPFWFYPLVSIGW